MSTTIAGPASIQTADHPLTPSRVPAVEVRHLSKRFGSLQALDDVSLTLQPGTFHALLGENGAGKSTLVKCVMGTYRADTGQVFVGQHQTEIRNPRQAHALGLGMVYQHFTLVDNMSVVENLVMAREQVPAVIHWKHEKERLAAFMDTMPFRVDPGAQVRHLAAGEKQKVEILKQLYLRRKVLILDEPTSVLTPDEADALLGTLRELSTAGHISVLVITHKFREVMAFCDEVTVLRRGRHAGSGQVADLTPTTLAKMMMGTADLPAPATRSDAPAEEPPTLLTIADLAANDETGVPALSGLSLHVKAHEIVGVAGVSGNGQRELVQILAGQRRGLGGRIVVHGERYGGGRAQMRRHHFHVLPEMPLHSACVGNMTTGENLAFRMFDERPSTWLRAFLRRRRLSAHADTLIRSYKVHPPRADVPIEHLSGGNIQRAVLARELSSGVEILIAANPCFGLDFKAVADIHDQLIRARNRGAAVLLVSEDLDEILELADRVLVISDGRIVHETPAAQADRHVIGHHMAGHGHPAHAEVH